MGFKSLHNLSVSQKLVGGFLVAALITAIVGGIGYRIISENMTAVDLMISEEVRFLQDAKELHILALMHRRYEKDFFLNIGDIEKQNKYIAKLKKVSAETLAMMETMGAISHQIDGANTALADASRAYEKYISGFFSLVATVQADASITPQVANKRMAPFKNNIYQFESNVDELAASGVTLIEATSQTVLASGKASRKTIMVLLVIGVGLSLLLGISIARMIVRPIRKAGKLAETMATGDFTQSIEVDQDDEIGRFINALNRMRRQLKGMIAKVIQGVDTLTAAATELSAISEQMSAGAKATSSKSDQVAAAAEKMSGNMNAVEMASGSLQVNSSAGELSQLSENLRQMVDQFKV